MLNFIKNSKEIIKAPLDGRVVNINDIPDQAFAQKMIGDGLGIEPEPDNPYLLSPVAGVIVQKFSTNHALGLRTKKGLEILLHMGIDTVELKGEGFEPLIEEGQSVVVGQKLLKIDWNLIARKAPAIISPIVITNMEIVEKIEILANNYVDTGDDLFAVMLKK